MKIVKTNLIKKPELKKEISDLLKYEDEKIIKIFNSPTSYDGKLDTTLTICIGAEGYIDVMCCINSIDENTENEMDVLEKHYKKLDKEAIKLKEYLEEHFHYCDIKILENSNIIC